MTRKENIQVTIIIVCLFIIGVILAGQFLSRGRKQEKSKTADASGNLLGALATETKPAQEIKFSLPPLSSELAKKQKTFLQRPWGRNPFVLMATKAPMEETVPKASVLANVCISAIVMRGDAGIALINDEMVRPGDTFRGYQVKSVSMQGVVLIKEGETVTIPYVK